MTLGRQAHLCIKLYVLIVLFLITWGFPLFLSATQYYVHPEMGDDKNAGTSLLRPFKSLERVSRTSLQAGDVIWLAAGQVFKGQLSLKDVRGTKDHPILVSSHRWGQKPEDARAVIQVEQSNHGVLLVDCNHLIIENVIVKGDGESLVENESMRCGVLVKTTKPGLYENIQLKHLYIHSIFAESEGFRRGKG